MSAIPTSILVSKTSTILKFTYDESRYEYKILMDDNSTIVVSETEENIDFLQEIINSGHIVFYIGHVIAKNLIEVNDISYIGEAQ